MPTSMYLRASIPFLEFLCCRAELAELVNSRAHGRESERLKRLREQFVEVCPGGNAGADVRIEMVAESLRNKSRNVPSINSGSMFGSSGVVENAEGGLRFSP